MSYNIALMPANKQRKIELDKHAALLIHNLKYGKVSRRDIQNEISSVDDEYREHFRSKLNEYKVMK